MTEVHEATAFTMLMSFPRSWSSGVVQSCAAGPGGAIPGLKRALQRAGSSSLQLLEGTVEAALQVRVGHNQNTLFISRHQTDLLRNARVQLSTENRTFEETTGGGGGGVYSFTGLSQNAYGEKHANEMLGLRTSAASSADIV